MAETGSDWYSWLLPSLCLVLLADLVEVFVSLFVIVNAS